MKRLVRYLNPIPRLGLRKYSVWFPLLSSIAVTLLSELYSIEIARDPMAVGSYIIFVNVAMILYFSFRDGIRGGFLTSLVSILYYFYIIDTRDYSGDQLVTGIETTLVLAFLFFLLATIIGYLKQKIDTLIIREAEERRRLQSIIQQLPVGIVITDNKGQVEYTNKKLEAMIGRKLQKESVAGKNLIIPYYYNGKSVDLANYPIARTITTGRDVSEHELVIQPVNGKKIFVQVNASLIHNREGRPIAAVSIIQDISEQKELEIRKDDFVNMASHELKTPITSMKLYIDLVLQRILKYNDDKTAYILTNLKSQTQRLQELVNDLLDVSRIQTGKLTFKKESFQLDDVIKETVEALQGTTGRQEIVFGRHKPIKVYADKFRIYQVLTNLLTNAIKYSPDKGVITVSAKTIKGAVIVSVKDQGIGIVKSEQKKIFDRLYQVTDPKEKTFPGLGMGLYISREIIKRHRGKIWVESEKAKGSTFYFTLPFS
jgi:PAS domain S-box-containing protein